MSRAKTRLIRFACIAPRCPEVTEVYFLEGSRGTSFEEFKRNLGEFMPCARCGGIVRRFKKHPREVEGMPGGAA